MTESKLAWYPCPHGALGQRGSHSLYAIEGEYDQDTYCYARCKVCKGWRWVLVKGPTGQERCEGVARLHYSDVQCELPAGHAQKHINYQHDAWWGDWRKTSLKETAIRAYPIKREYAVLTRNAYDKETALMESGATL
jgi:hypothetical protein